MTFSTINNHARGTRNLVLQRFPWRRISSSKPFSRLGVTINIKRHLFSGTWLMWDTKFSHLLQNVELALKFQIYDRDCLIHLTIIVLLKSPWHDLVEKIERQQYNNEKSMQNIYLPFWHCTFHLSWYEISYHERAKFL